MPAPSHTAVFSENVLSLMVAEPDEIEIPPPLMTSSPLLKKLLLVTASVPSL